MIRKTLVALMFSLYFIGCSRHEEAVAQALASEALEGRYTTLNSIEIDGQTHGGLIEFNFQKSKVIITILDGYYSDTGQVFSVPYAVERYREIEILRVLDGMYFLRTDPEGNMVLSSENIEYILFTRRGDRPRSAQGYTYGIGDLVARTFLSELGKTYDESNLKTGYDMPWVSKYPRGLGERLSFSIDGMYSELYIGNGFISSRKPWLYYYNDRVSRLQIKCLDTGKEKIVELKDTPNFQSIRIDDLIIVPIKSARFEMTFLDTFKGEKYPDLCIDFLDSPFYVNLDK